MEDYTVIKENELFLVSRKNGDIPEKNTYGYGLYTKDTRFLNRLEMKINGMEPVLLESRSEQGCRAEFLLTNPHIADQEQILLWRESVQFKRIRMIYGEVLYEKLEMTNFSPDPVHFQLEYHFDADFKDMFEVRGYQSGKHGQRTGLSRNNGGLVFEYLGLDGMKRTTTIHWQTEFTYEKTQDGLAQFQIDLDGQAKKAIEFSIIPTEGEVVADLTPYRMAEEKLIHAYEQWFEENTEIETDHPLFEKMFRRSLIDMRMLMTDAGQGRFPTAGVPWFAVPFGRDSLIASLQMLSVNPSVAAGTLRTMARYQGKEENPWTDEQPGKMMHELREGELARTGQIPFTPYYGTIDATPLFLVVFAEYMVRTHDLTLFEELLPVAKRALAWIDQYGDADGDGFVEYLNRSPKGIDNQGWKDSANAIMHKDGSFAESPIALVEVQAYVFHVKRRFSELLEKLGAEENRPEWRAWSRELRVQAETLKQLFDRHFWMEHESFYALALDAHKQPVQTITSNAGHILFSGIADETKAKAVSERLLQPDLFSGYGIRTMSSLEKGYNPISYHNGSVWPHDNSLALLGMTYSGFHTEAAELTEGLLKSTDAFELARLPELFCGYSATQGDPVPYPVACSPQAWASGTAFVMLESMLGLQIDFAGKKVILSPQLPEGMNRLRVRKLKLGSGILHLNIVRKGQHVHTEIAENTTGWQVTHPDWALISG